MPGRAFPPPVLCCATLHGNTIIPSLTINADVGQALEAHIRDGVSAFAEEPWSTSPFLKHVKQPLDYVVDYILRMPQLRHRQEHLRTIQGHQRETAPFAAYYQSYNRVGRPLASHQKRSPTKYGLRRVCQTWLRKFRLQCKLPGPRGCNNCRILQLFDDERL